MELLSSSGGSSKRAKAPAAGNVIQVASCLVDGCNSDLSGCREYHRRHRVCEQHSKTPKVTIRGQEQRFCQQCSRFHSLIEFDDGKRSCRKRLDGHNRRRRKPQLESFHTNPRVSHQQGSRLLSFSNPQMLAAGGCGGWAASGDVKRDQDDTSTMVFNSPSNYMSNIDNQNLLSRCSGEMSNNYNLQGSGTDPEPSSSACFDQFSAISSGNSQKTLFNGVGNSDGALSLLSSAAIQTQTRDDDPINIGASSHMMPDPGNIIPMPQSLLHNLHFSGIGGHVSHRMQTNPRVSDLQLDNNTNLTTLHFQGDSSGNIVSHQTLSFSWN